MIPIFLSIYSIFHSENRKLEPFGLFLDLFANVVFHHIGPLVVTTMAGVVH